MAHAVPLVPTPERVDTNGLWAATLQGCTVFLQRWMAAAEGRADAFHGLAAALPLPVAVAFADHRPTVLPPRPTGESASSRLADDLARQLAAARQAQPTDAPATASPLQPVWWPLPEEEGGAAARGAWVWMVGLGSETVALCLLADHQAHLAMQPSVLRAMALLATLVALALRLRQAEDIACHQAASLSREQARSEVLAAELEQAARTIDSFTALAAHELRTPLSALMLQADSAARLMGKSPVPIERIDHKVRGIAKQIERLRCLVEDLLDVSRLDNAHLVIRREEVDLAELARRVVARLQESFARAHTPLSHEIDASAVGTFDAARCEQVMTNLLSNALKYGLGRPVHLRLKGSLDAVELSVRDAGIGIPTAQHRHIFSRYGRAVSERDYGGLGLGLWISQQIVQAQGGHITVDSQLGAGALFTAHLPRRGSRGDGRRP